jgi:ABC-type antimicrobial peptide transport system permease subunit
MVSLKEIIYLVLNEAKLALREYMRDTEDALKKRIKKILLYGILTSVLVALITSFLGSASLFILIGSLRYLQLSMPAWAAWYTVGISSGITGGVLILVLVLIIRKKLQSNNIKTKTDMP